jgi:hypothetical protein
MDFHVLVFERVLARRAGGINTSLSARDCSSFSSHPYSLLQFPKAATRTVDAFGLSLRSIQKKPPRYIQTMFVASLPPIFQKRRLDSFVCFLPLGLGSFTKCALKGNMSLRPSALIHSRRNDVPKQHVFPPSISKKKNEKAILLDYV